MTYCNNPSIIPSYLTISDDPLPINDMYIIHYHEQQYYAPTKEIASDIMRHLGITKADISYYDDVYRVDCYD